jgi:hypothetical protein
MATKKEPRRSKSSISVDIFYRDDTTQTALIGIREFADYNASGSLKEDLEANEAGTTLKLSWMALRRRGQTDKDYDHWLDTVDDAEVQEGPKAD